MYNLPKLTDKNIKQWLTQLMEQTQAEINSIDLDNLTDPTRNLIETMVNTLGNIKDVMYPVGAIVIYIASTSSTYGDDNLPTDIYQKYGGLAWEYRGMTVVNHSGTQYAHYFERTQ